MKKFGKTFGMLLLSAFLSFSVLFPLQVLARDISDELTEMERTAVSIRKPDASINGTYLSSGTTSITALSNDEAHVMGITSCTRQAEKLYLYLYLEQGDTEGNYGTYRFWKFTRADASSLAKGINVKVPSGYYYRVRGYHAAEDGDILESVSTLTDGIWVGDVDDIGEE